MYLVGIVLVHLLTYLITYLFTYLLIYLITYLITYLFTYLITYLITYLLNYLLIYLYTYLLTYLFTYLITYLFTYLLTPWSRILLEKPTGFQPVKKFPAFYGTRRLFTAVTNARYQSLSWASSIQSTPSHPTSWRSILILSSHLRLCLPSGLFPSDFPTKTPRRHKLPHHHDWLLRILNSVIFF